MNLSYKYQRIQLWNNKFLNGIFGGTPDLAWLYDKQYKQVGNNNAENPETFHARFPVSVSVKSVLWPARKVGFFSPGFSLVASALGWGYEAETEVTRRTQWKSSWYSGYEKRVCPVLQNHVLILLTVTRRHLMQTIKYKQRYKVNPSRNRSAGPQIVLTSVEVNLCLNNRPLMAKMRYELHAFKKIHYSQVRTSRKRSVL